MFITPPSDVQQSQKKPTKASLIYVNANIYAQEKINKCQLTSFGLAIFAGIFIALAFIFFITVTTGADNQAWGLIRFAGGVAFSLGLILVVICGGELFTSSMLSSIAWAKRHVSTAKLLQLWTRIYLGNLLGAVFVLFLVMQGKLYLLDNGAWGLNALTIAQHKLHHTWSEAFALGVLCNMLVCLGVWMAFASKDALTKSFLLIFPVAMFVSSGFEHCIANLFMVPLGIAIHSLAELSFFTELGIQATNYHDLTLINFVSKNLIPVTLGNVVGGCIIALGYWLIEEKTITSKMTEHTLLSTQDPSNKKFN